MHLIEELVDSVRVINLANRQDRWNLVSQELAAFGFSGVQRFNAYGPSNPAPASYTEGISGFQMSGWWGNKLSHYGVIAEAKEAGAKAVAVFEDDVTLHPYFNDIVKVAMTQVADAPWDWLSFGGNHRYFGGLKQKTSPIDGRPYMMVRDGLAEVTPNVSRILKLLTAHAYIAKASVFDFILQHALDSPLSIDGFYAYEVHGRFTCYCINPCVASQRPGVNDIGGGYTNYQWYVGD